MTDQIDPDDSWHDVTLSAVQEFADLMKLQANTNPWPRHNVLQASMVYLMTELWDRGFSSQEISDAFESAISALPDYAAGER